MQLQPQPMLFARCSSPTNKALAHSVFVLGVIVVIVMYQRRKRMNRLEDQRNQRMRGMRDSTFGLDETMPYPHNGPSAKVVSTSTLPPSYRQSAQSTASFDNKDYGVDPAARPQDPRHMV
jgi:hypothetical protein